MVIKVPKTAKDVNLFHHDGPAFSRRDFFKRVLAMGAVGVVAPHLGFDNLAYAAQMACPSTSSLIPGGFAQIYMTGGGPAAVPIFPMVMANAINTTTAALYGVSGAANLVATGGNWMTDNTTPWGKILITGPAGVSPTTWASILKNTYIGGYYGDLKEDDGNASDEGLLSGFALINGKGGPNPKDIHINSNSKVAPFAVGPSLALSPQTPTALAQTLQMTPAATGLTTTADLAAVNTATLAIETAYETVKPVSATKGGSNLLNSAGCGFNNNPPTASASYGTSNYTPNSITNITNLVPAASFTGTTPLITLENQAILAAAYQSAMGFNGGVVFSNPNCDYHNQSLATTAAVDQTNANAVVAMLAGFAAAGQPGVIQINANGFASSEGVGTTSITINGVATSVQSPSNTTGGDAGGTFSQNLLLFYSPSGKAPNVTMHGTINETTGAVTGASGSAANSMVGAAASVLYFLNNGNIPNAFLSASGMSATQLSPLMVIS